MRALVDADRQTKIGCCAFQRNVDFREDLDRANVRTRKTLYIVTTGILPQFQRMGFGSLLKSWQISYARFHGFDRIVTNTRSRNRGMIALNEKFGFEVVRVSADYYSSPREATVVMELKLPTA
jgi:ribosomal protein S18 acetylase RimI-like enzyme